MIDCVRRFITRLGPESRHRLFQHLDLAMPDISERKGCERDKRLVEAVLSSADSIRGRAEAISAHVILLSDKGEYAERALRAVCRRDRADLLELLESDLSLEDRTFCLWLEDAPLLDRARNLAMSFHWRDGRYHCGFDVNEKTPLGEHLEQTIIEIQNIVQAIQGGRNVAVDEFTYLDETACGQPVHHFAVYLETPASALMEFREGQNMPIPVLRREAREIAIDYNPRTGRLNLSGKGVGGQKNFSKIAIAFASSALAGAQLTEVTHQDWRLPAFLVKPPPSLSPPTAFSSVRVTEMVLFSRTCPGGQAVLRAGEGQDVYDRMQELGISTEARALEYVYSITLTVEPALEVPGDVGRRVRVTISGNNSRSFDGASLRDRKIIDAWLEEPPFMELK